MKDEQEKENFLVIVVAAVVLEEVEVVMVYLALVEVVEHKMMTESKLKFLLKLRLKLRLDDSLVAEVAVCLGCS